MAGGKKPSLPYWDVMEGYGFKESANPSWMTGDEFTSMEPKIGLPSMVGIN